MSEHDETGQPPPTFGPGVNLPPQAGFIAAPVGSPHLTSPDERMGPLTQEEKDQFEYLRAAFSDQVETLRVAAMRVLHEGYDRVALVAVKDVGDEVLVTPLALLMDPALFEGLTPPEGTVDGPVQKDGDPDPETVRDLLLLVEDEFPADLPDVATVAAWPVEVQQEVQDWAWAVHLYASDNDDVEIPRLPRVLNPEAPRNS